MKRGGASLKSDFGSLFARPSVPGKATAIAILLTFTCAVFSSPLSAAGGEKSTQFDLHCHITIVGKITKDSAATASQYDRVISLDLRKKQYMFKNLDGSIVKGPSKIQSVSADKITLEVIPTRPSDSVTVTFHDGEIDRQTGRFFGGIEKQDGSDWWMAIWGKGQCSKAPFSGFPEPKF